MTLGRLVSIITLSSVIWLSTSPAQAYNDASTLSTLSALPVASVVVAGSAVVAGVVVIPVALSTAGATLVVKTVESTARGTVCILERLSDGAQVSLDLGAAAASGMSVAAGTVLTVSVIGAGVLLYAASEVVAFVPNAIGKALLHNERLTN